LKILFFAQLKDATRCDHVELELPSALNCGQLWDVLLAKYPELLPHRGRVRLARNWEYVDAGTQFTNTDEVALIPPVSGG
jgi:molybdopterin converting factor subunit 1